MRHPHILMERNLHIPPEELSRAMSLPKSERCRRSNHHSSGRGCDDYGPQKEKVRHATMEEMRELDRREQEAIDYWNSQPNYLVSDPEQAVYQADLAQTLLIACRYGGAVDIIYHGGSNPNTVRTITPEYIFTKQRFIDPAILCPIYIRAFCHKKKALRTFRLDRLQLLDDQVIYAENQ